jgi:hypothetical protein
LKGKLSIIDTRKLKKSDRNWKKKKKKERQLSNLDGVKFFHLSLPLFKDINQDLN